VDCVDLVLNHQFILKVTPMTIHIVPEVFFMNRLA
jgi:hypothetical protein